MCGSVVCFVKMSHTSGAPIGRPTRILNVRPTFLDHSRRMERLRPEPAVRGDSLDETAISSSLGHRLLARFSTALLHRCGLKFASLLLLTLMVSGCTTPGTRIDPRDFAVSTCELSQQQIALAQTRAREYLTRHPSTAGDVRLVAVIADSVFPSEVSDLWIKLGRSQTSSSAYLQRRGQSFVLWCVAVFDRSTLAPVSNQGYLLANTPALGEIVHMGGRTVLYIGRGN